MRRSRRTLAARLGGGLGPSASSPRSHRSPLRRLPVSKPIPYEMPVFDNVDDHRRHLKQRLAAAFRLFGKFGFSEGVAGHITAPRSRAQRPLLGEPVSRSTSASSPASDLILVNHDGEVVEGRWAVKHRRLPPSIRRCTPARPDMNAAAHAPLDQRQGVLVARPPARPDHPGRLPPSTATTPCSTTTPASCSTTEEGPSASPHAPRRQQGRHSCANHGLLTVGQDRRRSGLVVHHHGALLPGPSSWPARPGTPGAHRPRHGHHHPDPGRRPPRRLAQLPAAVRTDRPSPAGAAPL